MSTSIPELISLGATDLRIRSPGMGTHTWGFSRRAGPINQSSMQEIAKGRTLVR
jgi:hypothetical protein